MKLSKTSKVSFRIMLLFGTAIMLSLVPDYLHSFFNDTLCNGLVKNLETGKMEYYFHYGDTHKYIIYHWGYRHWLYFIMGVSLAIVQVFNIIEIINSDEN